MKKGLYANINARKKAGKSRSKSKSTISKKAYKNMRKGFPKWYQDLLLKTLWLNQIRKKLKNNI